MDSVDTSVDTETLSDQFEADKTLDTNPEVIQEKPEIVRHKVKVDGQELDVDTEELKRGYSHNKAAANRMREAQELKKSLEPLEAENKQWRGVLERIAGSEDDFWDFAEQMGYKLDDIVAKKALDIIRLENMSDSERQKELEYRQLKKKSLTWEQQEKQQSILKEENDYKTVETNVDNEIASILTKNQCKDPRVLEQMILVRMKDADADWDTCFDRANKAIMQRDKAYRQKVLSELDANELPDDVRARLRKADVERLKSKSKPFNGTQAEGRKTGKVVASTDDFFNQMEKKYK